MKQIIRLAKGKYIHLDSYNEQYAHPFKVFMSGLLVVGIATITVAAILGCDPTEPFQPTHSTHPTEFFKP
jgi:hypothetical protein